MRGHDTPGATHFQWRADEAPELREGGTCYAPGPMKFLVAGLLVVLALLQYRLWVSDEGMREVWHLSAAVESQRAENTVLAERNGQLKAEVLDLKQGLTALEERARHDLGMVAVNETFYQVVDTPLRPTDETSAEPASLQAATKP